ncbi:hypothetical protein ASC78_13210 [Variovorax sp. Root318D1]|uniref:hypothetical protein n=1 Tax=Variovorax sp. Root318D1 TaxID=1736513 RepID=UPI0006FF85F7|nr:hypothetical protein [Variovorax sp. Root318D1]KQU83595.1 hypothetical protein ASC78_13210 [Variovorax sp. Root318D1]
MTTTPVPIDQRLDLISETEIETYWFQATGTVSATLGEWNGPVCAPVFQYNVLSNDSIEIADSERVIAIWTRIEVDGDVLRAECNGQTKAFRIG